MNILAIDLGTHTGYCRSVEGGFAAGTWDLTTKNEVAEWGRTRLNRRRDPRVKRLWDNLVALPRPDIVVFEDVEFQTYTYQIQLWSSLRAAMWQAFAGPVLFECVPVSTLKKFATGSGGADKVGMKRALLRRFPEIDLGSLDDNAIDAIWIYKWAETNLSRLLRK